MRVHRLIRIAAASAGCVLALTACGGGKSTSTSTSTSVTAQQDGPARSAGGHDACDLLTSAEIKTAAAIDVTSKGPTAEGGVKTCKWASPDDNIIVTADYHERLGDLIKSSKAEDSKAVDVTGIGDVALLQSERGQITVGVGEVGLVINVSPPPSADALKALGRIAAQYT